MMYVTGHSILTSSRLSGYPPLSFLSVKWLTWISRGWWQPSYFKKPHFQCYTVNIYMWMWRLIYSLMRNILEQKNFLIYGICLYHHIKDESFWYLSNLYRYNLPVIVAWLGHLFGWYTTHHFSFKLTYTTSRTHAAIVPRIESSYKIKLL